VANRAARGDLLSASWLSAQPSALAAFQEWIIGTPWNPYIFASIIP